MRWTLELLSADPEASGWAAWYFILEGRERVVIGCGGFRGRPSPDGTVEIGYSILERHQRQGLAPEAVRSLVAWAFSHPEVKRVVAHTLPELRPSIRVLEACGFEFVGPGEEAGTIFFVHPRPE